MKVVVVDEKKAMHSIMKRVFAKIDRVEIVGCFQNTETVFTYLLNHQVELAFIDISMPNSSGLELAKRLRMSGWKKKLVFVTACKEFALDAFAVQAYDYILKPLTQDRLRETIERANADEDSTNEPTGTLPLFVELLTKREMEIGLAIAEGLSNKEIADRFGLTEGTVKGYTNRLYGKLGITRRVQVVLRLKKLKLLD